MWTYCLTHASCFPEGWEAEHASGPLAIGNGPCALVQYIADRANWQERREPTAYHVRSKELGY